MKSRLLPLLLVWGTSACAENARLPPVIDNSTYQEGAEQPARAPSNDAMLELLGRVEQLQSEVNGLRGQVEEQAHTIEELKRRQDNIYSDLDARVQKLEPGAAGGETVSGAAQPNPVEAQATEPQTDAEPQTGEQPPAGGETQNAAEPTAEPEAAEPAATVEPAAEAPEQPAEAAQQAAEQAPGDEKQLYQNAYAALKSSQYDQAIQLLKKLAEDYPNGEYADNAYYWLGETYKIKQDAESSRAAFVYLIDNFPASQKVPDAMLKLGFLEYEQNNGDRARELFNAIIAKYPGSSAANLAQNKLRAMDKR